MKLGDLFAGNKNNKPNNKKKMRTISNPAMVQQMPNINKPKSSMV